MGDLPPSAAGALCQTPPAAVSLRQLYEEQVLERGFVADPAQLAAVAQLDDLRRRLLSAARTPKTRVSRWLGALTGRAARAPTRGLYLWGGVGRGSFGRRAVLHDREMLAVQHLARARDGDEDVATGGGVERASTSSCARTSSSVSSSTAEWIA